MLELNNKVLNQIKDIHWEVTRDFNYLTDEERTGKRDFWDNLIQKYEIEGEFTGDCEDLAIVLQEKFWAKWPEHKDSFRIACVFTPFGGHAFCMIELTKRDKDDKVALVAEDVDRIKSWDATELSDGYRPWCIQKDAESFDAWVEFK